MGRLKPPVEIEWHGEPLIAEYGCNHCNDPLPPEWTVRGADYRLCLRCLSLHYSVESVSAPLALHIAKARAAKVHVLKLLAKERRVYAYEQRIAAALLAEAQRLAKAQRTETPLSCGGDNEKAPSPAKA